MKMVAIITDNKGQVKEVNAQTIKRFEAKKDLIEVRIGNKVYIDNWDNLKIVITNK